MSEYAHRNGEIEQPTEPGYYWFRGQILRYGDPQNIAGLLLTVVFPWGQGLIVNEEGCDPTEGATGQWWGPVTPPWKTP